MTQVNEDLELYPLTVEEALEEFDKFIESQIHLLLNFDLKTFDFNLKDVMLNLGSFAYIRHINPETNENTIVFDVVAYAKILESFIATILPLFHYMSTASLPLSMMFVGPERNSLTMKTFTSSSIKKVYALSLFNPNFEFPDKTTLLKKAKIYTAHEFDEIIAAFKDLPPIVKRVAAEYLEAQRRNVYPDTVDNEDMI